MKLNASHDLFVASDMVNAGLQDDGTPYISETFYVMLEDAHGNRYKHYHLFPATVVTKDEDGETLFISDKKQAEERAAQLLSRIKSRGKINMNFWRQGRPVYGSAAYIEYGQSNDLELEALEG